MENASGHGPGQERGDRLAAYRLRMAHIRAEQTGETVAQSLSVFEGVGRRGGGSALFAEEEAEPAASPGPCLAAAPEPDAAEQQPPAVADVIALDEARARRRRPES